MPDCSLYAASPDWMKLIVVIGFYLVVFASVYLISHTAIVIARLKYKHQQAVSDNQTSEKQYSYGMDENNHPLTGWSSLKREDMFDFKPPLSQQETSKD